MLRVTCPCGAPYSLGDHLAGRSFKCPKCGRVLKVGASSGAGSAAPPPGGGQSGWGKTSATGPASGAGRTSGTGRASSASSSSGYGWGTTQGQPPAQQPPKQPAGGGGLGFADEEGLLNSMDNSKETQQPNQAQLRQSGSGRVAKRKGPGQGSGRTSGVGRTSGTGRASSGANRRSSSRQQPAEAPRGGGGDSSHSRSCPVCDATIAKVAPECPSCGVILRGPNALQRLQGMFDWGKLTGALFPLAVIGAIAYGGYVFTSKDKPPEVVVRPTPRPTETPEATPTPSETPKPTETPEATPTPVDTAMIIPDGPLRGDFERLRDAVRPLDIHAAIKALVEKPEAPAALRQALESQDGEYKLKVHRAVLLAGEENERRTYLEASLDPRKGDRGLLLLYTVIAALDLDAPLYEERVLKLAKGEVGYQWGLMAIRSEVPDKSAIQNALVSADPTSRQLLDVCSCYERDGSALDSAVGALEYPSPTVRRVTLKGIRELAGDLGPEGDDVSAWRDWARAYAPVRELLGQACAEYRASSLEAGCEAGKAGQQANKKLCERAGEVFKFLPVFYRDSVSESTRTGEVLGLLLAKVGAEHEADARALVGSLDRADMPRRGGAHIVRGAMLGLDTKIAKAIAEAVSRGALSVRDDPYMFPVFVERADADDVKPFLEAVLAAEGGDVAVAWLSYSATRAWVQHTEAFLRDTSVETRYEVAARMAWEPFEKDLFNEVKNAKFGRSPLDNSVAVCYFLGKTATHDLASDFANLAKKQPNDLQLFDAFAQLARPEDIDDLKGLALDDEQPNRVAERVFKTLATAGGPDAYDILKRRVKKDDDPHRNLALQVIRTLEVDDKDVRREVAAKFEGDGASNAVADMKAVAMLGRVGRKAEQELLWKACYEGLGSNRYTMSNLYVLFVALGRMGYNQDILTKLQGYLYAGHRLSGITSLCYALFFHKERDPEGAALASEKLLAAVSGAEKTMRVGEFFALAALSTIDRVKAVEPAVLMGKAALDSPSGQSFAPVAFALAAIGSDETEPVLATMAGHPDIEARRRVATGVALAALARIIERPPRALEQLRYDRDEEVRGLAALALGMLGDKTAGRDLAQALAMRKEVLDKALQPRELVRMVPVFDDLPLRALLWRAAETLLGVSDKQRNRWHDDLGQGRVEEIERDLRKALLELK